MSSVETRFDQRELDAARALLDLKNHSLIAHPEVREAAEILISLKGVQRPDYAFPYPWSIASSSETWNPHDARHAILDICRLTGRWNNIITPRSPSPSDTISDSEADSDFEYPNGVNGHSAEESQPQVALVDKREATKSHRQDTPPASVVKKSKKSSPKRYPRAAPKEAPANGVKKARKPSPTHSPRATPMQGPPNGVKKTRKASAKRDSKSAAKPHLWIKLLLPRTPSSSPISNGEGSSESPPRTEMPPPPRPSTLLNGQLLGKTTGVHLTNGKDATQDVVNGTKVNGGSSNPSTNFQAFANGTKRSDRGKMDVAEGEIPETEEAKFKKLTQEGANGIREGRNMRSRRLKSGIVRSCKEQDLVSICGGLGSYTV